MSESSKNGDLSRDLSHSWPPEGKGLHIQNLTKSFGPTTVLDGVSFNLPQGDILSVLGPSGCGKSTLLALIAGLETPDRGQILWDGVDQSEIPANQRGFGLMFQDYALFPHMNVTENVAFGLKMAKVPQHELETRVREMLELVSLPGYETRDVNTLSGGEQQRVALARSLAPEPLLLMLDEPLGALDATLREELLLEIPRILRRLHQTAIYVTHDQEEAFALADQVVVMSEAGRVAQVGSPLEIFTHPASTFVAEFLGHTNILPAKLIETEQQVQAVTPIGTFPVLSRHRGEVQLLLRRDAASVEQKGSYPIRAELRARSYRGTTCRITVEKNKTRLIFDLPASTPIPAVGQELVLWIDPKQALQVLV